MSQKDFLVLGGDMRMQALANALRQKGYNTATYLCAWDTDTAVPQYADFSYIVLPIPATLDGVYLNSKQAPQLTLQQILQFLQPGQTVFGGMLSDNFSALAKQKGVFAVDYAVAESFQQKNAYLTAEGAISLAVQKTDFAIKGASCLIVGYGRIGKILAHYVKQMGALVQVAARHKDSLTLIEQAGYMPCKMADVHKCLQCANLVFNTVPRRILDLSFLPANAFYMELASKPYGAVVETSLISLLFCVIIDTYGILCNKIPKSRWLLAVEGPQCQLTAS